MIDLIFIAVIAIFAAVAVINARKLIYYHRINKIGDFAQGRITGRENRNDFLMILGGAGQKIAPVVEFETANGMTVKAAYKGEVLEGRQGFDVGTEVQVKYNPSNPEEFIIIGDSDFYGNALCIMIMGILFAAGTAAMIFIMT